jgi:dipeptide transport system permease protein
VTFPGLCILVTVVAINLVGDGLRDALDPKLKRS